jgi:hypothetical protein
MPRTKANPEINAPQFRNTLHDEGFCYLGSIADRFVDLRFPKAGRTILPVKNARGQILHAETLNALRASRRASEQERANAIADASRKVAIAARIAPQAMAKPRAGLSDVEAIATLADDLRTARARQDGVQWRDMLQLGWTKAQLDQYGPLAARTAYQLEGAL